MKPALTAALSVALVTSACALRTPDTVDPTLADRIQRETAPTTPLRAIFSWRVLDGDARFSGAGVARIEAPYRVRLDLFGPRDETYLSAALVDADLRLPGEPRAPLPPPAMIWASFGVVRPPDSAALAGTRRNDGEAELYYTVGESRLRYVVRDGRLELVEWRGPGRRMVVELEGRRGRLPVASTFRDWSRNTELAIELERVEDVDPYPPEIWSPGS